ncbi:MAG: NAD(P)H-binding protein [Balneolaceae bacterium]|nr:NAD(P)H-binding protein [Balneolaceae bacterium]MBO6545701.1 NAD(P)H-binding protein [Balneolaceae bacterium]MBO6647097.1 NAD(P)H-binding protein [Balneolaceae bacterium]
MNILVLGASGGCGKEVVSQAQKRGHEITALVRETTPFEGPKGVEVKRGSVLNIDTLRGLVQGKDAVISCLGLNRMNKLNPFSKITSPTDLTSKTADILQSILEPGTKVAVISAAGVAESFSNTNLILRFLIRNSSLGPAYRDLMKMEEFLSKSELDWHAVRPVTLTDFSKKEVRETDSYGLFDMISRASVASYLLDLVEGRVQLERKTPLIKN